MSKVIYAKLQTPFFSPGTGELGTVFPPQGKTLSELDMVKTVDGVEITFKYNARNQRIFIPNANLVGASLAPEVKSPVTKTGK